MDFFRCFSVLSFEWLDYSYVSFEKPKLVVEFLGLDPWCNFWLFGSVSYVFLSVLGVRCLLLLKLLGHQTTMPPSTKTFCCLRKGCQLSGSFPGYPVRDFSFLTLARVLSQKKNRKHLLQVFTLRIAVNVLNTSCCIICFAFGVSLCKVVSRHTGLQF